MLWSNTRNPDEFREFPDLAYSLISESITRIKALVFSSTKKGLV